jgi:hypothetical protein
VQRSVVLGFNLSHDEIKQIRLKQKFNPSIELLTYNDLLTFVGSTIDFMRRLREEDQSVDGITVPTG